MRQLSQTLGLVWHQFISAAGYFITEPGRGVRFVPN